MDVSIRNENIPEVEWARHMETITSLYLDDDLSLKDLAQRMAIEHAFIATTAQFEGKLKVWHARKNLKVRECESVLAILDKIPPETRARVVISGRPVSEDKVHRARRYCNSKLGNSTSNLTGRALKRPEDIAQVGIQTRRSDGSWTIYEDVGESSSCPSMDDLRGYQVDIPDQSPQELMEFSIPASSFQPGSLGPGAPGPSSVFSAWKYFVAPTNGINAWNNEAVLHQIETMDFSVPIMDGSPTNWLENLPYGRLESRLSLRGATSIPQRSNAPRLLIESHSTMAV
ncbi:hypothetical protein F5Y06DRAFT_295412 [Hypoxylon sp. FL0890]|nr:hypothetical protein F5Y06DRAFT_295412 [Hypoxylon sp. FL0890]